MGNTFKKFLGNKNTVTILGVLIGVAVLYFSYNYRVKQAIDPVSIPMAKVAIGATEEITEDMIDYVKVSNAFLANNVNILRNASDVINKRVAAGTSIPANGLFYSEQVVSPDELPDAAFANIPDGHTIYALPVTLQKTNGNTIYPGNYIDLYLKARDDDGKLIYGKFINHIPVLDVKDSMGNHVFTGSEAHSTPAVMLFAVPDDMYLLLKKAELVSSNSIEILPIQRNKNYSAKTGETEYDSDYLISFIERLTYPLPE